MPTRWRHAALALLTVFTLGALGRAQPGSLSADRGAAGAWQTIQKLRTFASVLHTTAHPDDEDGGLLTWLSRGQGARVSLLTLTRGEAGDNAIGPELFDALGLIRTEELRAANRYYGVDRQFFTSAIDYGFSKRVSEAWTKWDRIDVLREVVLAIRIDRPLVVVSRFQGATRDGHGQHIAAGEVTREAFDAAADPERFPEQLASGGLRPWRARRLYVGGVRADEPASAEIDVGHYSPWLGMSYRRMARVGLSLQRSQNAGRSSATPGPASSRYLRVQPPPTRGEIDSSFFDGLGVGWDSLAELSGRPGSAVLSSRGRAIGALVEEAVDAFTLQQPADSVPALAAGLRATREVLDRLAPDDEAAFLLRHKERQFERALTTALGLELQAVVVPIAAEVGAASESPPVVPGQRLAIELRLAGPRTARVTDIELRLEVPPGWQAAPEGDTSLFADGSFVRRMRVTVGSTARLARPSFSRTSLMEHRYTGAERELAPFAAAPAVAEARFVVDGVTVALREPVRRREARLPYGYVLPELQVLPPLGVTLRPAVAIVARGKAAVTLSVELQRADPGTLGGTLALEPPAGWEVHPVRVDLATAPGARRFDFTLRRVGQSATSGVVTAVATLEGKRFTEGYQTIDHRDLETRYLFRASRSLLRTVDVTLPDDLVIGYVMGIGDDVPEAIRQLGARVQLLRETDLAVGALEQFDAIVVGTRAYAVRPDLHRYNGRLLDYAERGGHVVVLYNTQEFDPKRHAPYRGELPRRAEEVSEEDAPVEILAPEHPVLQWPNRIGAADFEGWVEQRGSKFLSAWAPAYTALVSSHDVGQDVQRGGWLTAVHGRGHYTYFAYALHRQLPSGVPGAYRILANLLSMSRGERPGGA